MSSTVMMERTGMGMPGVSTWDFGEGYAELFLDSVAMNHNAVGRGFETFGNGSAETMMRSVRDEANSREWFRSLPAPEREFLWSARDNVNCDFELAGDCGGRNEVGVLLVD